MPSDVPQIFQVSVGSRPFPIPVAADLSSMIVGFFCGREGDGNFHAGGIRSVDGIAVHTDDVRCQIPEGTILTIKYDRNQPVAAPLDVKRLLEDIERSQKDYEQINGPSFDLPPEVPGYKRKRTFTVEAPGISQVISARLDRDSQLGATVSWNDGRCMLSVHSSRKQHIDMELMPRQQVTIVLD